MSLPDSEMSFMVSSLCSQAETFSLKTEITSDSFVPLLMNLHINMLHANNLIETEQKVECFFFSVYFSRPITCLIH